MTVFTNCAIIEFSLRYLLYKRFQTKRIDITLPVPNGDNNSCQVNSFGENVIEAEKGKHYTCRKTVSYPCTIKPTDNSGKEIVKSVANFVVDRLEFEFGVKIEHGFTTPISICRANMRFDSH